jgi:hypothetical protein
MLKGYFIKAVAQALYPVISIVLLYGTTAYAQEPPTGLLCNLLTRPELTQITTPHPQFGWIVHSEMQTAYRILVASSPQKLETNSADLWDSGKIISSQSQHIVYVGKNLHANSTYYWKVATWNQNDEQSEYSLPQQFNTGDFEREKNWPGESRWVKIGEGKDEKWAFEDRNPIDYHTVYPVKIELKSNNTWFIDFKKAAFAYAKFTLDWKAGENETEKIITVRIGEKAVHDSIDQNPGGGIILREYRLTIQPGKHEYELEIPRFKSHYPHSQTMPKHMPEVIPFRYCEIVCGDEQITLINASQMALYTLSDDEASAFSSDIKLLNDVYNLCRYSIKANTFNGDYAASQRERMMYEADAYIHQMGHYAIDREFSVARYSLENMIFHATWPTEWISHTVMMAWADYWHTGNSDLIKEYYEELKPKTLTALTENNGLISTRTGLQTPDFLESIHFNGKALRDIVDWPHGGMSHVLEGGETDNYDFTDFNTVVNAFHYHSLVLMAKMAESIGEKRDATFYRKRAENVKKAFNRHFIDAERGIYVDGIRSQHASLHANMYPLVFGLVPESIKSSVIDYIKQKGMACGVYGANYLLEAMFDFNEPDYALSLLTDTTDRSWYNMLKVGATMTTEAWDNKYKSNNGWSHAWSSSPAHILPRKLMGIEPLSPGFETIMIEPQPASVKNASVKLPTIRGAVKAEFINEPFRFFLMVDIPGNTKANVSLPSKGKSFNLVVDNRIYKNYTLLNGRVIIENISSGIHQFELNFDN